MTKIEVSSPEFNALQKELVRALLQLPGIDDYLMRSRLLQGLPPVAIQRSQSIAKLDLDCIVEGLGRLGRLLDKGGTRPLVVLVENALEYTTELGEPGATLKKLVPRVADLYGGEAQPVADTAQALDREALIFGIQRDARLSLDFVEGARRTARSVARLAVPRIFGGVRAQGLTFGTGWFLAPGVLVTNHHVVDARDLHPRPFGLGESPADPADFKLQGEAVEAWFDFHREGGTYTKVLGAKLLAADRALDYAVIELADAAAVADRPPLPVITSRRRLAPGDRVNIAQHAKGGPLTLAIRNNFYVRDGASASFVQYQTDTEPGASGSPVCDDQWNVFALHHASVRVPDQAVPQEVLQGQPVEVRVLNEAITLAAIVASLPDGIRAKLPKPS